jgi:hypothetical protein
MRSCNTTRRGATRRDACPAVQVREPVVVVGRDDEIAIGRARSKQDSVRVPTVSSICLICGPTAHAPFLQAPLRASSDMQYGSLAQRMNEAH